MESKYEKSSGLFRWDFNKGYLDFTDEWFLMSSPTTPILITGAYLLFVLKIGPAYMKGKQAYSLRNVIVFYNAAQVLYSLYLLSIGIPILLQDGILEKRCLLPGKEYTYTMMSGAYLYLIAKLTEYMETIFFVLRKKWNQISFLHVYHHSLMFTLTWFTFKYSPSYSFSFMMVLNTFVHVIMYTYYGLSSFPSLAKYLWWKKYITKLQLAQFFMAFVVININYCTSKCPQSMFLLFATWVHFFLFSYLFGKFYIENYNKKDKINVKRINLKDYL